MEGSEVNGVGKGTGTGTGKEGVSGGEGTTVEASGLE